MAASKNLLPSPPHSHHQQLRSGRFSSPTSVISFSCLLLTLTLLVFFFLPPTPTMATFTRSSAAINANIISFPSLISLSSSPSATNDDVSPPPSPSTGVPRPPLLTELTSCDLFNGSWVPDRAGPLYPPGSCPNVDDAFNCFNNGRRDRNYLHYRWKPRGCEIPRFNGRKFLSMVRNKRVAFIGDSLNRNMWQSLICSLRYSLPQNSSVHQYSHSKLFYSFRFKEYNCTIGYIKSPFLVQRWRTRGFQGNRRETLRLDLMQNTFADLSADVIVFNTGHWWTHHKTRHGIDYFQEGDYIHGKLKLNEAFKRALKTWARWVDRLVEDNERALVFFAGYSASHFRGGEWNTGGGCDGEIGPIEEERELHHYPWMMTELESVISKMNKRVTFLNITRMTQFRRDAHPSVFRHPPGSDGEGAVSGVQDCSHWCLPGVPDSWNQLLYVHLLMMLPQS